MATMVPPTVRPRSPSGEVKVFEALRDHPGTDGWLAWHGLPIRHHETQVEGEADFVIMVPGEGMLVVEVKSHDRLEVDDRGWSLGGGEPTARSPYDQVWDNSRSIRKWIERRAYVPGYPIWQAAWFPNIGGELTKRLEQRIDVPADSTLTRADLDPSRLVTSIVRILRHGARELERRVRPFDTGRPDEQDIADARAALVPAVRWDLELADRREARRRNLREATERQEEALRYFASNERLLVTGPAGTGKTNIAVRAAQLQANRDERVLLTCFNRLLEADLQHRLRSRDDITVARVHQLMLAYSGLTPPTDADDAWWNGTLPAATLAVTRAPGFEPPFTCLVADEAQDLARDSTLDVLDSLLDGGLAGSRVVLAVRQSPELARFVEAILAGDVYDTFDRDADEGDDPAAELHIYRSLEQQGEQLQRALASLWDDGWEPEEIVILSPKRDSAAARAKGLVVDTLAPGGMTGSGVRWGTVHAFKGLEAPVVIVTDVDETGQHWEDLLYVGMTRATERLVVLTSVDELAARRPGAALKAARGRTRSVGLRPRLRADVYCVEALTGHDWARLKNRRASANCNEGHTSLRVAPGSSRRPKTASPPPDSTIGSMAPQGGKMPSQYMRVEWPEGTHLSNDRGVPGAKSALARDGGNELVAQAKLFPLEDEDEDTEASTAFHGGATTSDAQLDGAVLGLLALVGVAVGTAVVVSHVRDSSRRKRQRGEPGTQAVVGAGAPAHQYAAAPPGWYDASPGRQRWWDGQRWTHHERADPSRTPAPAGWYDDGAGHVRWWDGHSWSSQVQPSRAPAAAGWRAHSAHHIQPQSLASSDQPRPRMTSAEWRERVRRMIVARAYSDDQWRALTHCEVVDGDESLLLYQRELRGMTAQHVADQISRMQQQSIQPAVQTVAAAGWYDDGSGTQRWWNGFEWTVYYLVDAIAMAPVRGASSPGLAL